MLFSPLFLAFRMRCRLQEPRSKLMHVRFEHQACSTVCKQACISLLSVQLAKPGRGAQENRAVAALCTNTHMVAGKVCRAMVMCSGLHTCEGVLIWHSITEHRGDQPLCVVHFPGTLDMVKGFSTSLPCCSCYLNLVYVLAGERGHREIGLLPQAGGIPGSHC